MVYRTTHSATEKVVSQTTKRVHVYHVCIHMNPVLLRTDAQHTVTRCPYHGKLATECR